MKCKREIDNRNLDHATLEVIRQRSVAAVERGDITVPELARVLGMNKATIYRWVGLKIDGGQAALLSKAIPGRPSRLSPEQLEQLVEWVRDHTPYQLRFHFSLWTLGSIADLIEREFGLKFSAGGVRLIMKRLGFSVQRPLHQAWQRDPVLVDRWMQSEYPKIVRKAKQVNAKIYFGDEAALRSDYHAGTTWGLRGQTPIVVNNGARFRLNMISAISPKGELSFRLHEGSVDAAVFVEFLKGLVADVNGKTVFLIVDNAKIHRSTLVQEYCNTLNGKLEIFYLPTYSPDLNPAEQIWKQVKTEVAKQFIDSASHMKSLVKIAFNRLLLSTDRIKSFFRNPDCSYTVESL
jgi:transposase